MSLDVDLSLLLDGMEREKKVTRIVTQLSGMNGGVVDMRNSREEKHDHQRYDVVHVCYDPTVLGALCGPSWCFIGLSAPSLPCYNTSFHTDCPF